MIPKQRGVRLGAAVFVAGLSLAGPQAVGVAVADPGQDSSVTVDAPNPGASAAGPAVSGRPVSRRGAMTGSRAAGPGIESPRPAAARGVTDALSVPRSAATTRSAMAPPRPALSDANSGAPDSRVSAPGVPAAGSGGLNGPDVEAALGPVAPASGRSLTGAAVSRADGLAPAAASAAANAVAVPAVVPAAAQRTSGPRTGGLWTGSGLTANRVPDQALNVIDRIYDSVSRWLSRLPAGPVTDFLQGALLLVRRTLLPQYTPPLVGSSPLNTEQDPAYVGWTSLWYASPLMRGTKGAPLVTFDSETGLRLAPYYQERYGYNQYSYPSVYPDDGVQGTIDNYSKDTVAVTSLSIQKKKVYDGTADSRLWDTYQTAILEPGDSVSYQLFSTSNKIQYLYFWKPTNPYADIVFQNPVYGGPNADPAFSARVALGILDPLTGRPSTYFAAPGMANTNGLGTPAALANVRTGIREGQANEEIWGSVKLWVKRETDGWQIEASKAYLDLFPNPKNSETSDWAIFTIHIDSL